MKHLTKICFIHRDTNRILLLQAATVMRTEIVKIFCIFLQTSGHPDTTGSDFNGPEKFNFIQILNIKFFEIR